MFVMMAVVRGMRLVALPVAVTVMPLMAVTAPAPVTGQHRKRGNKQSGGEHSGCKFFHDGNLLGV